jgi:hypothetical protein
MARAFDPAHPGSNGDVADLQQQDEFFANPDLSPEAATKRRNSPLAPLIGDCWPTGMFHLVRYRVRRVKVLNLRGINPRGSTLAR